MLWFLSCRSLRTANSRTPPRSRLRESSMCSSTIRGARDGPVPASPLDSPLAARMPHCEPPTPERARNLTLPRRCARSRSLLEPAARGVEPASLGRLLLFGIRCPTPLWRLENFATWHRASWHARMACPACRLVWLLSAHSRARDHRSAVHCPRDPGPLWTCGRFGGLLCKNACLVRVSMVLHVARAARGRSDCAALYMHLTGRLRAPLSCGLA